GMDEDPKRPGIEALAVPKVRELPPDGHEGGLQDVLGKARVAQDPSGDAVQGVADLMHQIRECLLVARASPLDEVAVHPTPGLGSRHGGRDLPTMRPGRRRNAEMPIRWP